MQLLSTSPLLLLLIEAPIVALNSGEFSFAFLLLCSAKRQPGCHSVGGPWGCGQLQLQGGWGAHTHAPLQVRLEHHKHSPLLAAPLQLPLAPAVLLSAYQGKAANHDTLHCNWNEVFISLNFWRDAHYTLHVE